MVQARHVITAKTTSMIAAKASNATTVKAAHVASEATHVASAEAATMSSASAAAAARLCASGNKAAGKHHACQDHRQSSSHDILHFRRTFRTTSERNLAYLSEIEPTPRWTGDRNACWSSRLNSLSSARSALMPGVAIICAVSRKRDERSRMQCLHGPVQKEKISRKRAQQSGSGRLR
jgi:hypothetical protein